MPACVLVTGGTGLVGEAIKYVTEHEPEDSLFGRHKDEQWVFIGSKDADLRNQDETMKLFEKYKPTHVIHLAALVGGLYANMARKLDFLRDNLLINENVLHAAHVFKCKKVISCLSTCVYPDVIDLPLDETKIHSGKPHDSNFGYAHAKRLVDIQNRAYFEQYGDLFTSAIPTNVFGPHDNFDIKTAHVLPALLHKCYLAQRDGTPFIVWGTGKAKRQFIYSRDLAKLFVWQLHHYDSVEPLILSVGVDQEVNIKHAADMVVAAMGYEGSYEFDTSKADGQDQKPASNAKLLGLVDFKFTEFEDALKETAEWFRANYETARTGNKQ